MRKIVFIVSNMKIGGAQRVISTIINNLNYNKFSPTLILIKAEGAYLKKINPSCPIIDLKSNHLRSTTIKLISIIQKLKPVVIFTTLGHINLFIALISILLPQKTILIGRATNITSHRLRNNITGLISKLLIRYLYPKLTFIVCQSKYMKKDFISNFKIPKRKLVIINNPINSFQASQKKIQKIKEATNYRFIAIGRFDEIKQFDHIIRAFSKLKHHNIELTLLGDGKERFKLEALVKRYKLSDKIHIIGYRLNTDIYFRNADCLIITSKSEGFPNVVIEAHSYGLPVLGYNVPSINEIIINDINGLLIEPNIPCLIEGILKIKDKDFDPNAITKIAKNKYNKDLILNLYENLFE